MMRKILLLLICLTLPFVCYAEGGMKALGALIDLILFICYSLTALSFFLAVKFYLSRSAIIKRIALLLSISLAIFGLLIILTSAPLPDYAQNDSDQHDAKIQLLVGYSIFIPNLLLFSVLPWLKGYPRFEAILGRISENNDIIIWVSIKRTNAGQIQINYRQALDNLRKESRSFYNLVDLGIWDEGITLHFSSYQEAIDHLRNANGSELKVVSAGLLQPEYRKLLKSEKPEN